MMLFLVGLVIAGIYSIATGYTRVTDPVYRKMWVIGGWFLIFMAFALIA